MIQVTFYLEQSDCRMGNGWDEPQLGQLGNLGYKIFLFDIWLNAQIMQKKL